MLIPQGSEYEPTISSSSLLLKFDANQGNCHWSSLLLQRSGQILRNQARVMCIELPLSIDQCESLAKQGTLLTEFGEGHERRSLCASAQPISMP